MRYMPEGLAALNPPMGRGLGRRLLAGAACVAGAYVALAASDAQAWSSRPASIVDLQPLRQVTSVEFTADGQPGFARLTNLNPRINAWFLLELDWPLRHETFFYHLENPDRLGTRVALGESPSGGIALESAGGRYPCALWADGAENALQRARHSGLPYAPLCSDRVYLRNVVSGTYTPLERVTGFLRDHVWGGDRIVAFVRKQVFQDRFAEKSPAPGAASVVPATGDSGAPRAAQIQAGRQTAILAEHLGIDVAGTGETLLAGQWYRVHELSGVYVSAIQPEAIAGGILGSFPRSVDPLDAVEAGAVDYLVAFDLSQFDLGFTLGTDHPRLDWSGREPEAMHDRSLPGPDGIGNAEPLARSGMVSPSVVGRVVATFAGGFKREHGAFRYGALARQNHATHYGFIEEGVVFSTLQPGLATLFTRNDGAIDARTWSMSDDVLLPEIRYARQNGVPLLEHGVGSAAVPGSLVGQWGAGNWSGSEDARLRTLRAGVCLQPTASRRFLIYGYFSTATPAAMARVFQAYGCEYAMHLDMNALEHTYLALYVRAGGELVVQHLIEGMAEVDRKGGSGLAPRFLSFPDDRDFFYLTRRD